MNTMSKKSLIYKYRRPEHIEMSTKMKLSDKLKEEMAEWEKTHKVTHVPVGTTGYNPMPINKGANSQLPKKSKNPI